MKTLMRTVHGSHLFGTSVPTSDRDYKSLHVPAGEDILLQTTRQVVSSSTGTAAAKNTLEDIDDESFALHKFFLMLREGDTNAIEMLFAPDSALAVTGPEWEMIRAHRAGFLNRRSAGFVGYCRTQAKKYSVKGNRLACVRAAVDLLDKRIAVLPSTTRLEALDAEVRAHVDKFAQSPDDAVARLVDIPLVDGRENLHWEVCNRKVCYRITLKEARAIMGNALEEYGARARKAEEASGADFKSLMHAVRVAKQAKELLSTGHLTLPRPAEEVRELLAIRNGERPFADIASSLDEMVAEVEVAVAASVLPKESDKSLMDSIVVDLYGRADRGGVTRQVAPPEIVDGAALFGAAAEAARSGRPLDGKTLKDMARNAGLVDALPAKELREGLVSILTSRTPSRGLKALNATGVLARFLPEVAAADGVVQNAYHSYDVLEHVMVAVDASAALGYGLEVRLAVLLHDVGKPTTATPREDGRGNRFRGHESVGAAMAREILGRLGFEPELVDRVAFLVREHMYPIKTENGAQLDNSALDRFLLRVGRDTAERLFEVRRCDVRGKGFDVAKIEAMEDLFVLRARARVPVLPKAPRAVLPIDGGDVVAALVERGLKPAGFGGGPEVGAALTRLATEVAAMGREVGREEALALLDEDLARSEESSCLAFR